MTNRIEINPDRTQIKLPSGFRLIEKTIIESYTKYNFTTEEHGNPSIFIEQGCFVASSKSSKSDIRIRHKKSSVAATSKKKLVETTRQPSALEIPISSQGKIYADILVMYRHADWDGMKAKSISKKTCHAGIVFIREAFRLGLPKPKFITPSPLGAIAFQWNTDDYRLRVRVSTTGPDGCAFQWVRLPDSSQEGSGDIDSVLDSLSALLGKG